MFFSEKDSGLSSFILNESESILGKDCTSDIKHLNGLCDALLSHNTLNSQELASSHLNAESNANFSQNPFSDTSLNNPAILNGLFKSDPSVLQSNLLCNGPSKSIPWFQTLPIGKDAQNGGLMVLCPPPQSLKSRRREKVNILK